MMKNTHGEMDKRPEWSHTRYCRDHRGHGPLFPCPSYPDGVLARIALESSQYREMIHDPEWRERQIANGIPPIVLDIFEVLAEGEGT